MMPITKVFYCPVSLIIPNESVAQTFEGKLLKRALNMNYTNDEEDIKRYHSYLDGQILNFFTDGGLFGRGGDLSRLNACELRLNLTLLDIEWNERSRSITQFINDNRKKHIITDDEETHRGIDGWHTWCSFMQKRSAYIGVTYPDTIDKLGLQFRDDGRSGVWELSMENLISVDSF